MLKNVSRRRVSATGQAFAIVASRYNARYVDAMLRGAKQALVAAGAQVRVVRVPGAFEIPVATAKLLEEPSPSWAAVLCLGVILQGQTEHARLVGEAVTQSLAALAVARTTPIIHEVLLLQNQAQAEVRCRDPRHNRGVEAAHTALTMARVMSSLGTGAARGRKRS